jgi:hypothetical protein
MANFNRQTDNRKAKLRRRRREVNKTVAGWQAEAGTPPTGQAAKDFQRKVKTLKKAMRYKGGS